MLFNETIDLPQLACLRISERANDIPSATLALTRRLRVRSPQAFGEFGSVPSREMCPLSHLEERDVALRVICCTLQGQKEPLQRYCCPFSAAVLLSACLPPPDQRLRGSFLRVCEAPPPRPPPERIPRDCRRWALFDQPWAVFLSCLECGVVSHCSSVSIRSRKPESNLIF